uniref:ATP synthase complex subunit 8 n=1 Tax=Onychiurus orientalis TaxID=280588 RepID=Q6DVH7_ONYOR|nr:ATP synthase F0 subunit 8 [Onychiurus orientalis]AAT69322.1 ATP synthase F0 subunit 8 [Onychiurus orientalis]
MPQMSPMPWLFLFAMFTLIFICINNKIFFHSLNSYSNNNPTLVLTDGKSNSFLWLW